MTEIVEFKSKRGPILVEVEAEDAEGLERVARGGGKTFAKAAEDFEQAVDGIVPAAQDLLDRLQSLQPNSASLEFGVKLTGELGGIFAKAAGEGHIKVTLVWNSDS